MKKRKIRAITLFKILLVINTNSYRFGVIDRSLLFKFWTLFLFQPPFLGIGATYDVRLRLIGKRLVDFLPVLIELFLGVTAEALRAKMDRKSAFCKWVGRVSAKFSRRRSRSPSTIYTRSVRPMNALQLCR